MALVAMGLCQWWLWVCASGGYGFVVGMSLVMGLCRWWLSVLLLRQWLLFVVVAIVVVVPLLSLLLLLRN